MTEPLQKIMHYVAEHGIVRPRDIEAIGFPREYLVRLHRRGKVNRPSRGIYTLPDANVTEWHSYAEVAKRLPEGVICLLSALAFHRNHDPESSFCLDCSPQRGTNACSGLAFTQDRASLRPVAD